MKKVNLLTFFLFVYLISSVYNTNSIFLHSNLNLKIDPKHQTNNKKNEFSDSHLLNEMLENKIDKDLFFHNMELSNKKNFITQLILNKEGKIIGYKPNSLKLANYLFEMPMTNLVKKDVEILNEFIDIYWLNFKLK